MNDTALQTIEQVEAFLAVASAVEFRFENTAAGYAWTQAALVRFAYATLPRAHKGVVRRYLRAVTGYSRAQVTRLIRRFRRSGSVRRQNVTRHRFPRRYTPADLRALAKTDELHGTLSGPATKKIFERAFQVFGDTAFERLSSISVGHLYNLAHFLERGLVKPPLFVQTIFGILGGIGADHDNLVHMKRTADRLLGTDYHWSILAAGRHQMSFVTMGAIMGGHVRVGLEDSLYLGRGKLAQSNAEQVARIRRILAELSLDLATPDEARAMLDLKGRGSVGF